jgi:uncharacterized membrane protein
VEVGLVAAAAGGFYHLLGWIGFAVWALFVMSLFAMHLIDSQHIVTETLQPRLPSAPMNSLWQKAQRSGEILDEDPSK